MRVATVDSFAGVAGKFHAQFRRDTGVGEAGSKAVPQRVEGPARNHAVAATLDGLQVEPRFRLVGRNRLRNWRQPTSSKTSSDLLSLVGFS